RRADNLRRAVESDDVAKWFREQIYDLDRYIVKGERESSDAVSGGAHVGSNGKADKGPSATASPATEA
ncbi:MAG: hypothetical protein IT339_04745, partial [Thermomicrobiales bacterium]|nr:hypothetical protein [Thermomicrobiales bacterium]